MANVIVQDHPLSDIRKERQNSAELKNFRLQEHVSWLLVWSTTLFSRQCAPVFQKNSKCFALKQAQYATVIQYMSRVPFRRMSSSFQHPKNVNGPANSYSSCKTKLKYLLQKEALLRCFQKSLSLQLPLDLTTLYPTRATLTLYDDSLWQFASTGRVNPSVWPWITQRRSINVV